MDASEVHVAPVEDRREKAKWYQYVGDFFNTVKAFIGTNYQALPFAFAQSGLVFGVIGLFIIAALTDHCICLLIKCKYHVINNIIQQESLKRTTATEDLPKLRKSLERGLGYGDIGKLALGKWGRYLIDISVWYTQLITVVCYFIFIGNAVYTIFPLVPALIPINGSAIYDINGSMPAAKSANSVPKPGLKNLVLPLSGKRSHEPLARLQKVHINLDETLIQDLLRKYGSRNIRSVQEVQMLAINSTYVPSPIGNGTTGVTVNSTLPATTLPVSTIPASTSGSLVNTTTTEATTTTSQTSQSVINTTTAVTTQSPPSYLMVSSAPSLKLLVLFPLPMFILTSLIQNIRLLSPFSVIATVSLVIGAMAVLVFLAVGFTICADGFDLFKWATLPLFIGQITGAYEGIGCVVPIEGSMEGNRWIFPLYLHGAVYIVFGILCSFGVLGYLRYGSGVEQLIILSMPQHSMYSILVDVTLIVSVACTFPLQFYPCLQIVEGYLFSEGAIFGPKDTSLYVADDGERDPLLPEVDAPRKENHMTHNVIPASIPLWKRNVLRMVQLGVALGLAVLLRNAYAYISAISGAIGASFLAFIMPCLIELKLRREDMSALAIIKNLMIIVISAGCSIATLIVFSLQIANRKIKV